jgi:choline dehydrogenase-like flavoprotein
MSKQAVDVLIVGAGASGAAIAWSLAETRMNIVCLDQGPWMKQSDYPSNSMDWEARCFSDFSINPNVRRRPADYPIDDSESAYAPANFNAVGGGTILWAAHFPRLKPRDFRVYGDDGVADDWPIDYRALEPFFTENDRMMGVSGLAGDPAYPPKQPVLPPIPLGKLGHTLARGFDALGWHWWPSDMAIASQPYQGRDACLNLGPCSSGCAQGAKASTDITYWPEAQRRGVRVFPNCRVREITVRADGMARGALYYDEQGQLSEIEAEIVIVACNGIGTPRLLLNSRSTLFPDGLANSSGLVGKNLMVHPYGMITGVFDEPLQSYAGPGGGVLWSHEFYDTDTTRGFVRGYSFEGMRGFAPATTALVGMINGRIPWGAQHHAAYAAHWERTAALLVICEDLPEHHNCVTLHPTLTDSHGIPAPKVQYRLSDNTTKMMAHGVDRAKEALLAAGAREVYVQAPWRLAGWHMMGTARMGRDPQRSVVNEWGRAHDVRNLFIVDGSVFVTSGSVNPTSTIQAVALYIGDQIKQHLDNLFD